MEISRSGINTTTITDYGEKDRFLKLPIDNYLSLIGIDPVPPQIALINAINNPKYRFVTAVLNRRTGKSFIANVIGHLVTLIPGSNILVIAPNYSLSSISWDEQRKLLAAFDVEIERNNAKDKIIELKNGSTIRMGSVGQVDSVVGRSYDLIIFDECALNKDGETAFNIQLRPTLDKPNSKAIFISTPRGKNWFHKFYKRGFSDEKGNESWISIRSTWRDNPRASIEDIQDARAGMSNAEFGQEYECEFTALEGQIYTLDKKNIIKVDLTSLSVIDTIAGLDLGFRDHTAFVVVVTDGYNYYIIDEFLYNHKTTSKYAEMMQTLIDKYGIDFIYIDSSAAQTKYDLAYDYDITTLNANKKSRLDGIGYVASLIDNDRVFVDESCVHVIDFFDNYQWDPREGLQTEKPLHNDYSHMADAVRYALYSHSYNLDPIGNG